MATRSRKGCIDCKQAKIKCDEVHPSCGTCARRRRQCRGYSRPHHRRPSAVPDNSSEMDAASYQSSQRTVETPRSPATTDVASSATSTQWLSPVRSPSFLPLDEILPTDKPFIEIYFLRHPSEMVMSDDFFIDEMNSAVISLLLQSPSTVGDSLCAIGENYVKDTMGASLVSNRKTRLLNRLRLVNEDGKSPELVLMLLLALCGAELTDPRSDGKGNALPVLIENVALVLEFQTCMGRGLSDAAKYFVRGVARQDLLVSLSRMQRPRIDPSRWLDEHSMNHADRLFGLTTSLAPVLAKLAALAEDVQSIIDDTMNAGSDKEGMDLCINSHNPLTHRTDLAEREASIRAQLLVWRPIHDSSLSMRTSRKLLLHAAAWRAAALLYLFRLFNRPGSSTEADNIALGMSYEVMMHISGSAEDIKLSLWPLFVAACELELPEDRDLATQLFDDICHARPILTTKRTKLFCVDQIWSARDRGDREVWDWMTLTRRGFNVFMPL